MSLETILDTIETAGEAELATLKQETEMRIQQILADAKKKGAVRSELAQQAVLSTVAGERARSIHQARLEALQIVAMARDKLVTSVLEQVRDKLMDLRGGPGFACVLKGLIQEAVQVLGDEELNSATAVSTHQPWLEIDPRDEDLVREILLELGLNLRAEPTLDSWGGIAVYSGDGRIVVTNTLESRLQRATPHLGRELVAYFEAANLEAPAA